ncbi:MAG: alpha-E domain-containing protein [Micrococcales bacterium]|nr:alpha-E domain-containing protein [Micrococcales bacterium]
MLSRIAESLFWIGRYVERADDTARLLDVHVQMLLEDPWQDEDLACRSLLSVMDRPAPQPPTAADRDYVLNVLAYDQMAPSSIAGSLAAARENARRAREIISSELWEALNTTWNALATQVEAVGPHDYFAWVRERGAVVAGIVDSTISRDDAWQFLVLGRSMERADMTARLLTTRALAGPNGPSWTTFLRSCGAHEAFLRTYHGSASGEQAAGFLLVDRLFPRSIVHALNQAEECLAGLEPVTDRAALDEARRHLGLTRTSLEYRRLATILDDLPGEMELVQRACTAASDAIRRRYFRSGSPAQWVGEAL